MHSFYVIMGGFTIDTNDKPDEPFIPGSPRLHLGVKGVLEVARLGLLPDISVEYIKDKSKADSLAKALVVTQAGWLIVQCIERAVVKLPLTMLELNTVAHAVCALVTYALWWHKPLDIEDPTRVEGELVRPLAAALWVYAKNENICWPAHASTWEQLKNHKDTKTVALGTPVTYLPSSSSNPAPVLFVDLVTREPFQVPYLVWGEGTGPERDAAKRGFRFAAEVQEETLVAIGIEPSYTSRPVRHRIDDTTINRWQLLRYAMAEIPSMREQHTSVRYLPPGYEPFLGAKWIQAHDQLGPWQYSMKYCADTETSNFPASCLHDMDDLQTAIAFTVFCICALSYGGIHASAWMDYFASTQEQLLWRISSIYVAALGILAIALMLYSMAVGYNSPTDGLINQIKAVSEFLFNNDMVLTVLFGALCMLLFLFYLFCRGFLVIEAFISLRSLPSTVYDTPSWTQYLAHL
jgi:hypothetical protein